MDREVTGNISPSVQVWDAREGERTDVLKQQSTNRPDVRLEPRALHFGNSVSKSGVGCFHPWLCSFLNKSTSPQMVVRFLTFLHWCLMYGIQHCDSGRRGSLSLRVGRVALILSSVILTERRYLRGKKGSSAPLGRLSFPRGFNEAIFS